MHPPRSGMVRLPDFPSAAPPKDANGEAAMDAGAPIENAAEKIATSCATATQRGLKTALKLHPGLRSVLMKFSSLAMSAIVIRPRRLEINPSVSKSASAIPTQLLLTPIILARSSWV
jgi:hypothetical protein